MANNMQGIYSPLPQSLSDSESDDRELTVEPVFNNQPKPTKTSTANLYKQNGHSLHMKESDSDSIIKIKRGARKMSSARKVAFVTSIVLCFLPIILFLWVLPCSDSNTCPVKIKDWKYVREDIELKGPISLVQGPYKTVYNVAVMYKGSYNASKHLKNGVLSITGNTGQLAWDFEQSVEPQTLNCSMLDVDLNGIMDCLEVDENGLKAIDTRSGQALWHAHSEEPDHPIGDLTLPVLLPDLNKDHVPDLLSIFKKSKFFVISGQTGKVLTYVNVSGCQNGELDKLFLTSDSKVRYFCLSNGAEVGLYELNIDDIRKSVGDSKYVVKSVKINEKQDEDNVLVVGDRILKINNTGSYPKSEAELVLTDRKNKVLKTWAYNNAYVLNAKTWSFENSKSKIQALKGHNAGFIVKIWQNFDDFQNLCLTSKIHKRSVTLTNEKNTYYVREVSSQIILITFNETNIHIINASLILFNQICHKNETECQPSLNNQKDSLLIADLNQDGIQELVYYYCSYVKKDDDYYLTSFLTVLKLEEELPQLYGDKK